MKNTGEKDTLLVVDDHPVVLEGLKAMLSSDRYHVLKARSAAEAVRVAKGNPEIKGYVIDMSLENRSDGLDLANTLRRDCGHRPVVIYTMHDELWNISLLRRIDAEGIVMKSDAASEIKEAVDVVMDGGTFHSSEFEKRCSFLSEGEKTLSDLDTDVLRGIAAGLGTKELSARWHLSEKAVEYHRKNILKKLSVKTMNEAVRRAVMLGIINLMAGILLPCAGMAQETISLPESVDLGLSVLWGDRNVGADAPEGTGMYFAFAETFTKDVYNWYTYTYCDDDEMLCYDLGTDNISSSDMDAARVLLGDGWRMPTADEARELIDSGEWERREADFEGGNAYLSVTTDMGELRIPITGYMSEGRLLYPDQWVYWTSNCDYEEEYIEEYDLLLAFIGPYDMGWAATLKKPKVMYGSAQLGMQIRPVRDRESKAGVIGKAGASGSICTIDGRRLPAGTAIEDLPAGLYIIDGKKILKPSL